MKQLSKELLTEGQKIGSERVERILQFGEGNFLRAFVDEMVDRLNEKEMYDGSIVVVQPIQSGLAELLNQQDGLYTLYLRGLENGQKINEKRIVSSISRAINPYDNFESYMACAKNPDLRFIVSNTTEAGIVYTGLDKLEDKPQVAFPAKVTAFLYNRYRHFNGDATKGLVFIPCELIDYNGTMLKKCVLQYAENWNLDQDFINWVNESNVFTNTLVDRIVTGFPKDEVQALYAELGYEDKLLNTGEIFHFWVIEGPESISSELPFHKIGLKVLWTDDATPYKQRKVRLLNGGHTISVLAAYLAGKNTVGELMADEDFKTYLEKSLFDEIIPTLDLEYDDLKSFAESVFDRFANPYIKHMLMSIALNSTAKYKARVLPSILEYYNRKQSTPKLLAYSFAALIAFYRGKEIRNGALVGSRNGEEYFIQDDLDVLELFKELWSSCDESKESITELVKKVCGSERLWGMDLNKLELFADVATDNLYNILKFGAQAEVKKLV